MNQPQPLCSKRPAQSVASLCTYLCRPALTQRTPSALLSWSYAQAVLRGMARECETLLHTARHSLRNANADYPMPTPDTMNRRSTGQPVSAQGYRGTPGHSMSYPTLHPEPVRIGHAMSNGE